MRSAALVTACLMTLGAGAVHAQVIVVGDTSAEACYRAAEFGTMGRAEGFRICTEALNVPGLTVRDRAGTFVNRAVIRLMAGDYDGSMTDADSAIRLVPRMGEAHVNRGAALLNMARPGDALAAINIGMQYGTAKQHLVYYNRAAAKELVGDIRGAYYDYRRAVELSPGFLLASQQLQRFQVVRRDARNVPLKSVPMDMENDPSVEVVALRKMDETTR